MLERIVEKYGQSGSRQGAGQDQGRVGHRDSPEDQLAEAAAADQRRQCGHADDQNGCCPDAGHDNGQSHRQFDHPQDLQRSHPHAGSGLDRRRVDPGDPGIGVAQDRQQSVNGQRDDGRYFADSEQRNHEPQQGQARYGLEHRRHADDRFRPFSTPGQEDAGGDGDQIGQEQRNQGQLKVLPGGEQDVVEAGGEDFKQTGPHGDPPPVE